MDLQDIQDQLNTEFAKSETRIIFWFDDKGEYEDEVSELQLGDVKPHILDGTNWLYSKYLLNEEEKESKYLAWIIQSHLKILRNCRRAERLRNKLKEITLTNIRKALNLKKSS